MQVVVNKSTGLRNDLLVLIPREELETIYFNIANRRAFMELPGLLRGPDNQDPSERMAVGQLKRTMEEHLRDLTDRGAGLVDGCGMPRRRMIAIGSRNVGNNRSFEAWQHDQNPRHFQIRGDRSPSEPVPMLAFTRGRVLVAREVVLSENAVIESGDDVSDNIDWCVFANCVLRNGQLLPVEKMADQFYDLGHLVAADRNSPEGKEVLRALYDNFDLLSRNDIIETMRAKCLPRNRYLHSAVGLSSGQIIIVQREGTPEEIGSWLREIGAEDGFILDNGGSVFCWAWWLGEKGGYLYAAPDFRPPSSAVLVFAFHGPAYTRLPRGSVSYSVL